MAYYLPVVHIIDRAGSSAPSSEGRRRRLGRRCLILFLFCVLLLLLLLPACLLACLYGDRGNRVRPTCTQYIFVRTYTICLSLKRCLPSMWSFYLSLSISCSTAWHCRLRCLLLRKPQYHYGETSTSISYIYNRLCRFYGGILFAYQSDYKV